MERGSEPVRSAADMAPPARMWFGHVLIVLIGLALLAQVGRLIHIHGWMRPALLAWSEPRRMSTIPLPGRRGAILDQRGRVLAGSEDKPTVYADPAIIEDHAEAARELALILSRPAKEIRQLLDEPSSPRFVVLQRWITGEQAEAVRELGLRGVGTHNDAARTYPMGKLAAHVLGFVGRDNQGLEGIELLFDAYLRPTPGRCVVYRDRRRRAVSQKPEAYTPPSDGQSVVLTLDAAIQEVLERQLHGAVEKFEAESGIGLVLSVKSGAVLAMACSPTFDPAEPSEVKMAVRRNRILTDPVEPGSVFKPFIMAAAIEEGLTHPEETIFCHNGLYLAGKRRLHDHHPYGDLTVEQIMTKSSNIGMAILGERLGNARMYHALRDFGFGGPTGIDLPGEGGGLLMPLATWSTYTTTSVPMGHEMAVTPIQLAAAFAALVNDGHRIQPYVVAAVLDRDGKVLEDRRPHAELEPAINPATSSIMRDILAEVVSNGTGRRCQLDDWQVMGKTGTAQVPRTDRRGYEPDAYLGSFIASAPARDPQIVALIMIRKPNRRIGYYGSQVAAPGVKVTLDETLSYLGVPPDPPELEEEPVEETSLVGVTDNGAIVGIQAD